MQRIAAQELFRINGEAYFWHDVFFFAHIRGDLRVLEQQLQDGLACAEEAGEEYDSAEIEELLTNFRYDRNLVSAEDAESWLEKRLLTIDDLWQYLVRLVLRREHGTAGRERVPGGREQLLGNIRAEGFCSGAFEEYARTLAAALALCLRQEDAPSPAREQPGAELEEFLRLYGLGPDFSLSHVPQLCRAADVLAAYLAGDIEPEALRRGIQAGYMDLTRIHYALALFAGPETAQEAALCVRRDGMAFEDLAEYAQELRYERCFLKDLPAEVRSAAGEALFSARPGEVLGPCVLGDLTVLLELREKSPPSEGDPAVRERVRGDHLRNGLAWAALESVEWQPGVAL